MEILIFKFIGMVGGLCCFILGYRQTLGAQKARVVAANAEVEKILLRRMVLENYTPEIADISRLLEGKARDFQVQVEEMLSEDRVLNSIFTRILESELIARSQREEILGRMLPVLQEIDNKSPEEATILALPGYNRTRRLVQALVLSSIAVVSSFLGGLVTALPRLGSFDLDFRNMSINILVTAGLSLILIILFYTYRLMKESRLDLNPGGAAKSMEKVIDFGKEVARLIEKKGLKYKPAGVREKGYDFELQLKNEMVLVQVKAWDRPMPISLISHAAAALGEAVQANNAQAGILVTKAAINAKNAVLKDSSLSIQSLQDFKNLISR
jgi:hypothetical protein